MFLLSTSRLARLDIKIYKPTSTININAIFIEIFVPPLIQTMITNVTWKLCSFYRSIKFQENHNGVVTLRPPTYMSRNDQTPAVWCRTAVMILIGWSLMEKRHHWKPVPRRLTMASTMLTLRHLKGIRGQRQRKFYHLLFALAIHHSQKSTLGKTEAVYTPH